jgi:hypothetical protein
MEALEKIYAGNQVAGASLEGHRRVCIGTFMLPLRVDSRNEFTLLRVRPAS